MARLPAADSPGTRRGVGPQGPAERQTGADSATRSMTTGRFAGSSVAEPREADWMFRIYADPSVFHGCEDENIEQIRNPSRRLFEDFHSGRATLVTSPQVARTLRTAPEAVRMWLRDVPAENRETVDVSDAAETLANGYLAAEAFAPDQRGDALHVAVASIAGVPVLTSWKGEELEGRGRVRAINAVNKHLGYSAIDILNPGFIAEGDDDSPNAKEFSCMKWTRKVRQQIHEETKHMSSEEFVQWLNSRRPTNLRAC